jgi:photosystem II stability/assembly factor-like uncharacterized protein
VDPQTPGTLFASPGGGLHRSLNAGGTWTSVPPSLAPVKALAIHPTNGSTVFAATLTALHRSSDRGNSWTGVLASSLFNLVFDPQNPSVMYGTDGSASYYYGTRPGRFYKSTDGGTSWTTSTTANGFYPGSLAVDPTNSSILYAGDSGLWRSTDSGSTWARHALDPETLVSDVVFDPQNPNTIFVSSFGGVFRSVDHGESWNSFSRGLGDGRLMYRLVIDGTGRRLLAMDWYGAVYGYQIYSGPLDLAAGAGSQTNLAFMNPTGATLESFDGAGGSIDSFGFSSDDTNVAAIASAGDLTWVLWSPDDGGTRLQVLSTLDHYVFHDYAPVGSWTAVDIAASTDRTATILWTNPDGRVGLWQVDSYGIVSRSTAFGPYPGWVAHRIAEGTDGRQKILWTHSDGRWGLSTVEGEQIVSTHRFTPSESEDPWTVHDVTVANDGDARILVTTVNEEMALWSVNDAGIVTRGETQTSPPEGQTATRAAAGPDGMTRVLWTSPEGPGTVFLMRLDNTFQSSFGLN